jgi:hypothetical protein
MHYKLWKSYYYKGRFVCFFNFVLSHWDFTKNLDPSNSWCHWKTFYNYNHGLMTKVKTWQGQYKNFLKFKHTLTNVWKWISNFNTSKWVHTLLVKVLWSPKFLGVPNFFRCTEILSQHHFFLSFYLVIFYHVKTNLWMIMMESKIVMV